MPQFDTHYFSSLIFLGAYFLWDPSLGPVQIRTAPDPRSVRD